MPVHYNPNSIVDYLKSQGQASDFASRAALGGTGYTGTAEQNTALLTSLRTPRTVATSETATNDGYDPDAVIGAGPNAGMTGAELERFQNSPGYVQPTFSSSNPTLTRNTGESDESFRDRIRNQPFRFAGGEAANYRPPVETPQQASSRTAREALTTLNPEQTGEYNKQLAIALRKGVNAEDFAREYAGKAKGGLFPSLYTDRAVRTVSNAGTDSLIQGDFSKASGSTSAINRGGSDTRSQAEIDAERYKSTFEQPETEQQIIERRTAGAKGSIAALNEYYASLLAEQAPINAERSKRADADANARAVLSGLSGSSEATTLTTDAREGATAKNTAANRTIQAEQSLKLQNIYTGIQDSASREAREQKLDAGRSADAILERRDKVKKETSDQITIMSKSGFDFASIKNTDPERYKFLADSVGGEDMLKAISVLNRPEDTILDKSNRNGGYDIVYQNPLTKKITMESTGDIGIPKNYTESKDFGDRILFYEKGRPEDGVYMNKGIAPEAPASTQATQATAKATAQEAIVASRAELDASKNIGPEADGKYADPNLYMKKAQEWAAAGGTQVSFLKEFPPSQYINPVVSNTIVPEAFMPKKPKAETTKDKPRKTGAERFKE